MDQQTRKTYLVIGGRPFQMYTGTLAYTAIYKLGEFDNKDDAEQCRVDNYDECCGLIEVFAVGE